MSSLAVYPTIKIDVISHISSLQPVGIPKDLKSCPMQTRMESQIVLSVDRTQELVETHTLWYRVCMQKVYFSMRF